MRNTPIRIPSVLAIMCFLLMAGCASEDENIINPPPGTADIRVRFFNLMPDNTARRMLLERNVQTAEIPTGSVSAVVVAPGDSSLIELLVGAATELRTTNRQRFTRGSIYDVFVVGDTLQPAKADTVLVFNASLVPTTIPTAQVRVINLVPESNVTYTVRIGCPSGLPLTSTPIAFRFGSTYREVPAGFSVFTLVKTSQTDTTILGTFECTLNEFVPYSIIFHSASAGGSQPSVMLIEESDTTANVGRSLTPVVARNADIRVVNVSAAPSTVTVQSSGQTLASLLASGRISTLTQVTTCERIEPDVFALAFADGRTAVDSTSLNVRQEYTIVTADTADQARIIIIPPPLRSSGSGGKAVIRVTNASAVVGPIVVSIGARTDATAPNGFTAGKTIASGLTFDNTSAPFAEAPGQIPVTVSTAGSPTRVLGIMRFSVEADRAYELIVADNPSGGVSSYLIDDDDLDVPLVAATPATVVRIVNASPTNDFEIVNLGSIVSNARLFYRGGLTTSVDPSPITVSVNSATATLNPAIGERTLAIYAEGGGTPNIIQFNGAPLLIQPRASQRRVVNATADVGFVSVAYDSVPKFTLDAQKLADRVAYGQASTPDLETRDRRGNFYVYDSETFETLFQLPVNFGTLGNSYTLVVAGNKSKGYDIIILQEY